MKKDYVTMVKGDGNISIDERNRILKEWYDIVCNIFQVECPDKLPLALSVYTSGLFKFNSAMDIIYEIAFQEGEENALGNSLSRQQFIKNILRSIPEQKVLRDVFDDRNKIHGYNLALKDVRDAIQSHFYKSQIYTNERNI